MYYKIKNKEKILEDLLRKINNMKHNKSRNHIQMWQLIIDTFQKTFFLLQSLPTDNSLWVTNNWWTAYRKYFEEVLFDKKDEEFVLWALAVSDIIECKTYFGLEYLLKLIKKDMQNIRWLWYAECWVTGHTGARHIGLYILEETLRHLRSEIESFEKQIENLISSTEDPDVKKDFKLILKFSDPSNSIVPPEHRRELLDLEIPALHKIF